MINNTARIGNFTSSEIFKLLSKGKEADSFGKPALTYIEEMNMERRLGRAVDSEINARPTSWGKLLEKRVFDLLGLEYTLCSDVTIVHPEIDCWAGSPDGRKLETVIDIKAPSTLKSFCRLVAPIYEGLTGMDAMRKIIDTHPDGEKYFTQLVSNAILSKSKFAELIVYVPYKSELAEIRELASNYDGNQNKFSWINWAEDDELAYLVDGGYYKNLNIIQFEVPEMDKEHLDNRVRKAKPLLISRS